MKKEFTDAMQPGVKYAGYAWVNCFHEFQFTPSQKGKNEGRMQIVKEGNCYTVHTTKENIVIHLKIPRMDKPLQRIAAFLDAQKEIIDILKDYDLSKKPSKPTKKK